jgi:hypothetical protein
MRVLATSFCLPRSLLAECSGVSNTQLINSSFYLSSASLINSSKDLPCILFYRRGRTSGNWRSICTSVPSSSDDSVPRLSWDYEVPCQIDNFADSQGLCLTCGGQ